VWPTVRVPYQIASAIFSGTAPLIAAWFVRNGEPLAIAWYVMAVGLVCGVVFCMMPETRSRALG
jgi:hypothetical protein